MKSEAPLPSPELDAELVAPCGMNCGLCSAYQALANDLPRIRGKITHCTGCRPRNKQCSFLKKRCRKLFKGEIGFCFECGSFPCTNLQGISEQYVKKYNTSLIENLKEIKTSGIEAFLQNERVRFACGRCYGVVSIHNGKCYRCDSIKGWRG